MTARRLGLIAALVTMAGSGWYVFVYLYRWEWNRALISGVIFLAAEIGLMGALVIRRLARIERRLDELPSGSRPRQADPAVLGRLREGAPPRREPFAWLGRRPDRVSVFVPVLLGAGVVLSGLAWLVERVARHVTGPVAERGLARRLQALALPPGGFLARDDESDLFSPLP